MSIKISKPDITYATQYVNDGKKSSISLRNLYDTMLVVDENGNKLFRVPWEDFFIKHQEQLKDCTQYQSVPQSMFYKPKTLSLELYGTTELWLSILRLNGMRNITEFHYPLIQVYNPTELMELINIFFKREGIR